MGSSRLVIAVRVIERMVPSFWLCRMVNFAQVALEHLSQR